MKNDDNRNIVCGIIGGLTVLVLQSTAEILYQGLTGKQVDIQLAISTVFAIILLIWLLRVTDNKPLNKVGTIRQVLGKNKISNSSVSHYIIADLYRQYMQREIGKVEFCRILNIDRPTLDKLIEEFAKKAY